LVPLSPFPFSFEQHKAKLAGDFRSSGIQLEHRTLINLALDVLE